MKMETEAGGRRPHAKGCLKPPGARRGGKDPSFETPEAGDSANTLVSDFQGGRE